MTFTEEEFELSGPEARGKGIFLQNGFLVKAGSLSRKETAPSGRSVLSVHQRLIDEGVLVEHGNQLRFAKDHLFKSPSGAAAAVLGRTANGWTSWKRPDGLTLSEVKRVTRDINAPLLSESKRQKITARFQELLNNGNVPSVEKLESQYLAFKQKFGPDVLAGLDGEALLTYMHDHSDRNSLVYWLEFKDDDEFSTRAFGSIAGGSALKFRVFRRKETGKWQAGVGSGNKPQDITKEQAIEIARDHRDQLLRGASLLEAFHSNATDDEYAQLQDQLDEVAPDVSRLAFGHKYFSLLFPDKLDDYHSPEYQRFHLLKLLQLPPDGDGRYVCAGRFLAAAKEVNLPINHFTATLNFLEGRIHRYWRIGTTPGEKGECFWPMMRDQSCIAIGWSDIGEVSWVDGKKESLNKLKDLLGKHYPNNPKTTGREASQIAQFVSGIKEGDVILAADGKKVRGIGKVIGEYEFSKDMFPHRRKVEWLTEEEWQLPQPTEGLMSTVRELGKFNENLLAIEQHIQSLADPDPKPRRVTITIRLNETPGRIQSILDRKGQVIIYGPPGTGKTYWAERTANDLAALTAFGKLFESLDEKEQAEIHGKGNNAGLVRMCCFHPAYGYEDFLEGYRPLAMDSQTRTLHGHLSFELRDGVFKQLCKDANSSPDRNFYLIIDEINRGDIPRIFGELLTSLEKDKRGKRVILPVSQEIFTIPKNVYLLGTMNTADRSISLLDAALRRRFGFVELMPDGTVLKDHAVEKISLKAWLEALNTRIRKNVGRDARNLQIGHSYLMHGGLPVKEIAVLKRAIRDDIIPLLEEYCYEDYGTLAKILGEQLVDLSAQRIRHELFEDGQEKALIDGLLVSFAEISNTGDTLAAEEPQLNDDEDEETES